MLKFSSKSDVNAECKCIVRLLDDSEVIECDIQPRCKAQYLLDYVCQQLDVVEKDYFGLRYVDHHKQRKWFDFTKSVANQVRDAHNLVLCFRVKFYPPDPMRLQEATRYQLYLQLKRDLQHGRLYSPGPGHDLAFLAALCLQEELGDYDPERHLPGYVSEMNLVLNQSEKLENQVEEFHSGRVGALVGISASQAVNAFLKKAATLDTYGVDPHPVKDPRGARLYIGTNHSGVATFHNGRRTHHFRWIDISKLNYEGKMFIIHLIIMEDARTKKKHTVGFKCATSSACRHLWRYSVEQRIFFTFTSSAEIPAVVTGGSFFSRGSKVRYSGRVERELALEEVALLAAAAASQEHPTDPTDRRHRSASYASRRSTSEPISGDGFEYGDDEEETDDLSFDRHRSTERTTPNGSRRRNHNDEPLPRQRHRQHDQDVLEGHDSYEASSCGSGASQDDRSDVASWVALDLRGLPRHHLQHQQPHHSNGYDTLTIDSDFYGYAGSTTGSTAADPNSWSLHPDHDHQWRERDHSGSRHSASPAHYSSSSSRYKDEPSDGWSDSVPRQRRRRELKLSEQVLRAAIPLLPPGGGSLIPASQSPSGPLQHVQHPCKMWTKRILLLGTSLFTAFSFMALTLILVYETDFHWAIHLRHWPEMVFIQRHLYIPFRNLFPLGSSS
ncbi:FERM domain-containing protein 3-like [Daphnia carinata]|uniref:FERM domain-containing protein 3-like n=1 Tax=Daphnia carinata TaxID=120202 RepID=UPI00257EF8C4|nr:FERM domain-containing protein 3-like [Daphnia carinata]